MTPYIVEFLGTAFLLAAFLFGGQLLGIAALAIAISLGSKVSGGYFNPAATFFHYLKGDISEMKAFYYVCSQYAASVAVFLLYSM
jgi:glycerol uptake facilitator-like aquaporin